MNLAVIEGFYGRSWTLQQREHLVSKISQQGFTRYCYAPKSDNQLRKHWQHSWPREKFSELIRLSEHCLFQGVEFELGFSPFGLVDNWNESTRVALKQRIENINQLSPSGLNILFDDMSSCNASMGRIQAEIADFIAQYSCAEQFIVCPSYYSFDPVLEDVFGPMPLNYLDDFGKYLPKQFDVFWTGDKVISESYAESSIEKAARLLQREPVIWDNSLANDGKKTSPYLKFSPMLIKQSELPRNINGLYINPMNQAAVAEQVLNSFFNNQGSSFAQMLDDDTEALSEFLLEHQKLLSQSSLADIGEPTKETMKNYLYSFQGHALAKDIYDWLDGQFIFDPECLT